ncbi:pentatricopeptide repeat-containing protein 2, mitochondrial isoform X2 [Ahaetulla prasina]|uniref:pentatricopeptide repeat-containing protein 2, mitochondrial isoform X2 n=1 Tax=Ahaetulla prasina TaxID=499056 RepID=UPI002647A5A8|nr:pentatricopeptide repeat-containing protein 2, mitochondrial isoform X2 [Ahaetulla prasina]
MAALVVGTSGRLLRKTGEYPAAGGLFADRVGCWKCFQGAKRYLLTEDVLQLRKFQEKKLENEYKLYGQKDEFLKTVEKKLANNTLILKLELINVLYLCQSKNEMELVKRTIYRYHEENKNRAFGEFRFGPIFMRLCYELDLAAVALELIKDQTLNGFFGDYTSFNILMDMLFEKGHYEDALDVLLEMDRENVRFSQDTYLLAFAICYKLNDYLKAQYYFSQLQHTESIIYDNLKILLLAAFGNLKNLVQTLEKASKIDTYFVRKPNFCKDVIIAAREKLELDQDFIIQFEEIVTKLKDSGQINELTLDDLLCEVPHSKGYKMQLLKETKRSQRTLQPLQSFLLTD